MKEDGEVEVNRKPEPSCQENQNLLKNETENVQTKGQNPTPE